MPKTFYKALGRNLRHVREAAGLRKVQLASLLGVSPAYVTILESGRPTNPTIAVLYLWAKHCHTTLAELVRDL